MGRQRMMVAGIDVSTFAIDVVWIDLDDLEAPHWCRYSMEGRDAWERCRDVGREFPGASSEVWDETTAIGMEVAFGPSSGDVNRCVGAVLSRLPQGILIERWSSSQWKKAVGLAGNAKKQQVMDHVLRIAFGVGWKTDQKILEQDACDAYCIALATRQAITTQQAA